MSEKMRHAIETRGKMDNQVILEQDSFLVAEDVRTLRTPSPPPRPAPIEPPHPDYFTINQLMALYAQVGSTFQIHTVSLYN